MSSIGPIKSQNVLAVPPATGPRAHTEQENPRERSVVPPPPQPTPVYSIFTNGMPVKGSVINTYA